MKLPPRWKVIRELRRVGTQIAEHTNNFVEIGTRFRYEVVGRRAWRTTQGVQQMGPKLAVFVVFQPKGVAASIYMTLEYLCKHGFTVLITSNAALNHDDRQKFASLAWKVIERPNFGYDFGAYRDSILYLRDQGVEPDHLLLMNDSTWFPLSLNSAALPHVVAVGAPFYGFVYKTENVKYHKRAGDHMESHFLSFRKPALDSAEFKDYWAGYKMSSSRNRTIQTGEKGISRAMERAGFASEGMISHRSFVTHLETKMNTELRDILSNVIYHRSRERTERDHLLESFTDTDDWRKEAMNHFYWCLDCMQYFVSTAFIAVSLPELKLPFIKKAREDRFHLARVFVLEHSSKDHRIEIDEIVLAEIAAAVDTYEMDPHRE